MASGIFTKKKHFLPYLIIYRKEDIDKQTCKVGKSEDKCVFLEVNKLGKENLRP